MFILFGEDLLKKEAVVFCGADSAVVDNDFFSGADFRERLAI